MTWGSEVREAARTWWRDHIDDGDRRDEAARWKVGYRRMTRARLRRCDGAAEALAVEATHELHQALGGGLERRADTLALIAVSLANVRAQGARAAERMGEPVAADRSRLAPLRFQALIRVEGPGELIRPLRRALDQIDNTADVAWLAWDLLRWDEEVRNGWCFQFYRGVRPAASSPNPDADPPEETQA